MKESTKYINIKAKKRAARTRSRIHGTEQKPRMSVHVSNQHLYVQCVNDDQGKTLASVSDSLLGNKARHVTVEMSKEFGKKFAELAKAKGIESVVFDRGKRLYHGRIKSFAEGAREGGLKF